MSNHVLNRQTFTISRMMEFFTTKELQMQIGHPIGWWPAALLKELVDNALDACEGAGVQPSISVVVGEDFLIVEDNGPGLPRATLERSLDYAIRVSDKSNYVSPSRGQLGNALKCVWAAPFVATGGDFGCVEIVTGGYAHRIEVSLDRIAQKPVLKHTIQDAIVKNGTSITMHWPEIATHCRLAEGEFFTTPPGWSSNMPRSILMPASPFRCWITPQSSWPPRTRGSNGVLPTPHHHTGIVRSGCGH